MGKLKFMAIFDKKSLEVAWMLKTLKIMLIGFHITLTHPNIRNPGDDYFLETAQVPKRQDTIFDHFFALMRHYSLVYTAWYIHII